MPSHTQSLIFISGCMPTAHTQPCECMYRDTHIQAFKSVFGIPVLILGFFFFFFTFTYPCHILSSPCVSEDADCTRLSRPNNFAHVPLLLFQEWPFDLIMIECRCSCDFWKGISSPSPRKKVMPWQSSHPATSWGQSQLSEGGRDAWEDVAWCLWAVRVMCGFHCQAHYTCPLDHWRSQRGAFLKARMAGASGLSFAVFWKHFASGPRAWCCARRP